MRNLIILLIVLAGCRQDPPVVSGPDRVPDGVSPTIEQGWMGTADGMPLFLRSKFEPVEGAIHVPPVPTDLQEENRYFGNELGPDDLAFLDDELATMVGFGDVHACVELDAGLFILRTPSSQEGTTDLVLAAWNRGLNRLVWIADLAWSTCADDGCTGQEAWLLDSDGDRLPELFSRAVWKDAQTGVEDVTWTGSTIGTDLMLRSFEVDLSMRGRLGQVRDTE